MSARGVRSRLVKAVIEADGLLDGGAFSSAADYAFRGPFTTGELEALVAPRFLVGHRALVQAGVAGRLRVAPDVVARAQALAATHGVQADFVGFAVEGADTPQAAAPATDDAGASDAQAALAAALAKGTDLGDFSEWTLQTPGADVAFHTEVFGRRYPALVMDKPAVTDPNPRDLVADHREALSAASDLEALRAAVQGILEAEQAWFRGDDLDSGSAGGGSNNRRFAIQNQRRSTFLVGVRDLAVPNPRLGLQVNALLIELRDDIVSGRAFDMECGSHENYWPYDNGYSDVLEKIWGQEPPGSHGAQAIANRLADIYRRKTVFRGRNAIDERDAERTLGGVVIWRPPFASREGHRVSVVVGSDPYKPSYEVLTLGSVAGEHAGARVFRGSDGTLRFDLDTEHPERTGQPVPDAAGGTVEARPVNAGELSLRRAASGETLRDDLSFDWNRSGSINIANIDIGWWGHCHNEAPANAMSMDPRKGVTLYRQHPDLAPEAAAATYSEEDCWDLVGAFTADHEGDRVVDPRTGRVSQPGYVLFSSGGRYTPALVNDTSFVGNRNNGGHWLQITPAQGRRIRVEAEVTRIFGLQDPTVEYRPALSRFRRDIENDDGTFNPNPDWVESGMSDSDMIAVNVVGRKLTVKTTFITFDSRGQRVQSKKTVTLDPAVNGFVDLADEIESVSRDGGGRLVVHAYNPSTQQLRATRYALSSDNRFEREEQSVETSDVTAATAVQETTYDSVVEIDEYVVADMGLPLTFDTSAGQAVWNYPVDSIRRDVLGRVSREEDGQTFTYTTYRLTYTTMGGPDGDPRYIIKRDDRGRTVRALALDPMPDFAYRNEHWVCAPLTPDRHGRAAINHRGLTTGYVTDPAQKSFVTTLWERQATLLYASMTDQTAPDHAWLFETQGGELLSFASEADWRAAVDADAALRTTT